MGLKTKLFQSGMNAAVQAAQSPKTYAAAAQLAPFLKNGVTGAMLRGSSRNATVEAVAGVAELGVHPLVERIGAGMLTAIDFAVGQFASSAAVRADVTRVVRNELDERALERQVVRDAAWKGAARGAVSATPAVIPAAGTAIELATAVADQLVRTVAEARMVLALAHLRGLDVQQVELRRLDILLVLGLSAGAAEIDGDIIRVQDLEISIAELQYREAPHRGRSSASAAGRHERRCRGMVRLARDGKHGKARRRVLRCGRAVDRRVAIRAPVARPG